MERIKFYIRVLRCWASGRLSINFQERKDKGLFVYKGGHDWKNIIVIPPYKQCRRCGGFDSVSDIYG